MSLYVAAVTPAVDHSVIRVLNEKRVEFTIPAPSAIVDLCVHPNGKTLIAGLTNGSIIALNGAGATTPIANLAGLSIIALSDNGRYLAAGNSEGFVLVWELVLDQNNQVKSLGMFQHRGSVTSLAFMLGSSPIVLSGGTDELLYMWNGVTGATLQCCEGHTSEIQSISPGLFTCMTAGGIEDNTVKLWNLETGLETFTTPAFTETINSAIFVPTRREAFIGTEDGRLTCWDLQNNKMRDSKQLSVIAIKSKVNKIIYSFRENVLAVGSQDGFVSFISPELGLQTKQQHFCYGSIVGLDRFVSPDVPMLT